MKKIHKKDFFQKDKLNLQEKSNQGFKLIIIKIAVTY